MHTRSGRARVKAGALQAVTAIVDRLQEEYVLFVPETIPFLSELLEDGDEAVVANTHALVKRLEGAQWGGPVAVLLREIQSSTVQYYVRGVKSLFVALTFTGKKKVQGLERSVECVLHKC